MRVCETEMTRPQLQHRVTVWAEAGSPSRRDTGAPWFIWLQMERLCRAASAAAPAPDRARPLFFRASMEVVRKR